MWNKKRLFHRECSQEDGIFLALGLRGIRSVWIRQGLVRVGKPVSNSAARTGLIKIDGTVWFGKISYVFVMFHSYSGLAFYPHFTPKSFWGLFHLHLRRIPFFLSNFSDLKLLMLHNTPDNPSLCFHLMSSFPRINTGALRVWDKHVFSEPPSQWKPESGYFKVSLTHTHTHSSQCPCLSIIHTSWKWAVGILENEHYSWSLLFNLRDTRYN